MIVLRPLTLKEANELVNKWHRHHKPVKGYKFAIGASIGDRLVGAVIVGRPVAPELQDGFTFEVTRLVLLQGLKNVGTKLLGAAWQASKAMGVTRLVSYTRIDESGHVFKAVGWSPTATVKGREWNTGNKRQRWLPALYSPSSEIVDRTRWEIRISR